MASHKSEIITFKADRALQQAMQGLPNRSEFIRAAVLAALESTCPLCRGTGILSAQQREHWSTFARSHSLQECDDCHEWHLVCGRDATRETDRHAVHD